jgi:hypothetical protein
MLLYILLVAVWYTYYIYLSAYNAPVSLSLLLHRLRLVLVHPCILIA